MNDHKELAWKKREALIKKSYFEILDKSFNNFDIEECRVNGILKGFILYKKENRTIYISEMFFDSDDTKLFFRTFRELTRGFKYILGVIDKKNTPMISVAKRLGCEYLGNGKYLLTRKVVNNG